MQGKTIIILSLLLAYSNINILGIADLQTIFLFLFSFFWWWGRGEGGVGVFFSSISVFCHTIYAACKLVNFYEVNRCNGCSKNASAVLNIIYFPDLWFLL